MDGFSQLQLLSIELVVFFNEQILPCKVIFVIEKAASTFLQCTQLVVCGFVMHLSILVVCGFVMHLSNFFTTVYKSDLHFCLF